MKKVRVGVVGVGHLGEHHARIYKEGLQNVSLEGIYDIDEKRASEVAQKYACRQFNSLEEMALFCEAASVVVPTNFHCEVALALLSKGVHLLIEKPICSSLDQAYLIMEQAKKYNRIVQIGHIEHYNPVMKFLENVVKAPRFISSERLAPFGVRGTEVGVVLDLMIHDIGILLQLVDAPIQSVDGVGVSVLTQNEDIANARIIFENGVVANLNTSRVSEKKVREIRIFEPSTYLSLDFMNQKGHYWIKHENNRLERGTVPIQKQEPLKVELQSFVQCIQEGLQQPKVNVSLGLSALDVAIKVVESIVSKNALSDKKGLVV